MLISYFIEIGVFFLNKIFVEQIDTGKRKVVLADKCFGFFFKCFIRRGVKLLQAGLKSGKLFVIDVTVDVQAAQIIYVSCYFYFILFIKENGVFRIFFK